MIRWGKTNAGDVSRRRFLTVAAVAGGTMALSGCAWTPRNATEQHSGASSSQASAESSASSGRMSEMAAAPAVNDGLALIRGGSFTMGSPADEPWRSDDEVAHDVTINDFFLDPMEVSQIKYNALMGRGGGLDGVPVTDVTWYDAIAYCNALSAEAGLAPAYGINGQVVSWDLAANGYRLPTEAEWE
ncbi:MAG TPA: hypothetical protein DCP91_00285, partial [Eggerthellaceae bacterium]|nr:hypothetical protein [Eggerthellaceae bacterium]